MSATTFLRLVLALAITLSVGFFTTACGDGESDGFDSLSSSLDEQGAEAVDSPGYCKRADKAKKAKQNGKKVMICHIPPGNPANAHTIVVSKHARDAHLAHGDDLGACGCDGDNPNDGDDGDNPGAGDDGDDGDNPGDGDDGGGDSDDGDDGGNGYGDGTDGGNGYGDGTDGGNGYGGGTDGGTSTLEPNPEGGTGDLPGGQTIDPTPTPGGGSTGEFCDADQTLCGANFECPANNVCDLGCCVVVIL